jgi:hypothetical protein
MVLWVYKYPYLLFTARKNPMESNPLKQYFRQPSVYVRLPSQGKFWPKDSLNMPANGELPVLPMTTMDEITYRTPDALFNGSAVVSVIQSCMPNITDAWHTPSTDIDTLLISVRIATYGHTLDISSRCPACQTEHDFGLDLRGVMDQIQCPDYTKPLIIGDLEIWFKPMTYHDINTNNLAQFEDQKTMQALESPEVDEDTRLKTMGNMLKKLTAITTQALGQNIAMVKTPAAQVIDPEHIRDWLMNCDKNMFNRVRDYVLELRRSTEVKPVSITCPNCANKYDQAWTLDMTTFFEDAS